MHSTRNVYTRAPTRPALLRPAPPRWYARGSFSIRGISEPHGKWLELLQRFKYQFCAHSSYLPRGISTRPTASDWNTLCPYNFYGLNFNNIVGHGVYAAPVFLDICVYRPRRSKACVGVSSLLTIYRKYEKHFRIITITLIFGGNRGPTTNIFIQIFIRRCPLLWNSAKEYGISSGKKMQLYNYDTR